MKKVQGCCGKGQLGLCTSFRQIRGMATPAGAKRASLAPRPRKVLLVALNPLNTDRRLHRMANSLQRLGYAPALLGVCHADTPNLAARPYPTHRLRVAARSGWRLYAAVNMRLFAHLLFAKYDVLTANDLDVLPACYLAARIRRRPLVLDSHELFTEQPSLVQRPTTRRFWQWLEGLLLPRVRHHITVNVLLATYLHERYQIRPTVIYNWPPLESRPETQNPANARIQKILLYQGSLQEHRGIALMLEALLRLPGYTLWIVGSGPAQAALREWATLLHVTMQVKFWGEVDALALNAITVQATLGLSLEDDTGLNNRYATPNKVYDYLHAGLPVIVSSLPGHEHAAKEQGYARILTERNPHALATLVQEIVEDEKVYVALHQAALAAAKSYSWERQEAALAQVYADALR